MTMKTAEISEGLSTTQFPAARAPYKRTQNGYEREVPHSYDRHYTKRLADSVPGAWKQVIGTERLEGLVHRRQIGKSLLGSLQNAIDRTNSARAELRHVFP